MRSKKSKSRKSKRASKKLRPSFGELKKKKISATEEFDWLSVAGQLPSSSKQKSD